MEQRAAVDPATLCSADAERVGFTRLNLYRSGRIGRTWAPSAALTNQMTALVLPQTWMVLSEPWCGDSAQILPIIGLMAAALESVELLIVPRDDHPAIMDHYLTHGKRSIPLWVAFDATGKEIFRWGPRPPEAQAVFDAAKAEGLDKPDILEKVHLFFGRDRGQAVDKAFVDLFETHRERT